MRELNICIAGLGNVGSNLIATIIKNNDHINSKALTNFNIKGISAKNKLKKRIFDTNDYLWFDDPLDMVNVNNCDVIIELIGEEKGLSFELVKKALENKKHVVTANKALLAKNGMELFHIAEQNKVLLLFEAAVAGGIPIIKTIKNNIFLNNIKKVSGILNGTTNYILTNMFENNKNFDEVLSIAESKGYTTPAEAELDIGGLDSAHKLTLLATICFGSEIKFINNIVNGISKIDILDMKNAYKLGYKIKLISEAYLLDNQIYCFTGPKLLDIKNSLANVDGVLNAINLQTDQLQSLFLEGEGAGGKATASSVISDLYEITSNSNITSLGYAMSSLNDFKKLDSLKIKSPYFLRIMSKNFAGVLSKITSFFKDSNISIEKIIQLPDSDSKNMIVPIIITTYDVNKKKLNKIIDQIEKLDFVLEKITIIPIHKN